MRWWWTWVILILCLVTYITWRQWPTSTPVVSMCDVGQGDAMVITQGFSQLVMDVGSSGAGILPCLSHVIPFWDREIETVVITHADSDHFGALKDVLTRYQVGQVITSESSLAQVIQVVNKRSRVTATWAHQGWKWGTITAQVIWPEHPAFFKEDNQNSLVVRVELSPTISIWLAGDTDERIEAILVNSGSILRSSILKVAHHGSATATSEPFLAKLRPSQAWISVGKDNRYGHPANEVINRLTQFGATIRRTDEVGMIQFRLPAR